MSLPRGATAVDFAYAVHTDIGNRCVAVKINDELMPLRTELRSGDRVEIYRALIGDPKEIRKLRAAEGKKMKRGAGAED